MRERYRRCLSDSGAGARHCRDSFLCLHFHALVVSPLNMQKALRGDDFAAILILSININRPVPTGWRQGFPELATAPFARRHGIAYSRGHDRNRSIIRSLNAARTC
ncbi:hypothetical protein BLAT2472_80352 [Burkholderia latens]